MKDNMIFELFNVCARFVNEPTSPNGVLPETTNQLPNENGGEQQVSENKPSAENGNFTPVVQEDADVNFELEAELNELATEKDFGSPPEQNEWKSSEIGEMFAKGGKVKQSGSTDKAKDIMFKAKRVGYRYTDELAKKLKVSPNAKPTQAHIEKYEGNGVYKEIRKNRSDKKRTENI